MNMEHLFNLIHFHFIKPAGSPVTTQKNWKILLRFKQANIAEDKDGHPVYLAQSEWFLNTERNNNPDIEFHFTSEIHK